jgi:hypothetical protein
LHIDWYDYGYTIEQKRKIIKTSVNVHRKLGTRYAVETALRAVYTDSKVIPWFENGGEPYSFEVILDISQSDKPVRFDEVEAIVSYYKSLRDNVSKTEFVTQENKEMSCAVIPVTGRFEIVNPEYEDITVGKCISVLYAGYLSEVRGEIIECEIITPVPDSGNSDDSGNGEIVGGIVISGIIDAGIVGEVSTGTEE